MKGKLERHQSFMSSPTGEPFPCIAIQQVPIATCNARNENKLLGGERSSMRKYTKNMEVSSHIKSRTTRNNVRAKRVG